MTNLNYPLRLQRLLAQRKYTQALNEIETSISDKGGIFANDPSTLDSRRMLWLIRIDLLNQIGKYSEALAWVCLECELNPSNVTAIALKHQLKLQLKLNSSEQFQTKISLNAIEDVWKGVYGMRQLKSFLDSEVVLPLLERETYETMKISVPNGVLFYGPTGCGKTFISKRLSERLKWKFIVTKPSDFASEYIHGSQLKIKQMFEHAAANAPCVLLLDELDALIPDRNILGSSKAAEVNEFLTHLDRASKKGILVVGTTNYIDKIDTAAIRPGRFDLKILIESPDFEARVDLLKQLMRGRPQEFIDWELIGENTEEMTYSDLKLLVDTVAKMAIKINEPISMKQFYEILKLN